MDFSNIAIPFLIFLLPLLAAVFLLAQAGATKPELERKIALSVFGIVCVLAAVGLLRYQTEMLLGFNWPISLEPSGNFELSLNLRWTRFIWVFFTSASLLVLTSFDSSAIFGRQAGRLHFLFLLGALFFSSLAFLSANIFLSVMFTEMVFFMLHLSSVLVGGEEGSLERVSYFRRAAFLFTSAIILLLIAVSGQISLHGVIVLAGIFNILTFLFSRHNFIDWKYLPIFLIQSGVVFFLLEPLLSEELPTVLWMSLAAILSVLSITFALFSIFSAAMLNAAFWLLLCLITYFLTMQFISGHPQVEFWTMYSALGLLSALSLGIFMRFGSGMRGLPRKIAVSALSFLLFFMLASVLPAAEAVFNTKDKADSVVRLVFTAIVTFFLSFAAARALALSHKDEDGAGAPHSVWVPAVIVLAAMLALTLFLGGNFQAGTLSEVLSDNYTLLYTIAVGGALLAGFIGGILLNANKSFHSKRSNQGRRMEAALPGLDTALASFNNKFVEIPSRILDWSSAKIQGLSEKISVATESSDSIFFGTKMQSGVAKYGTALSLLSRIIHSGNMRAYLFVGILISLFVSALFVLGGA